MARDSSRGACNESGRTRTGTPARTWVLFLHGNASTVASRMNVKHYTRLRELGLNVLAPEYRGYNGLEGVPSEAGVAADARAAYDYLRDRMGVPAERVVIFGWSLGAAVAVGLASTVEARGVVLEGAPASIVDIGQARYPMFPVRWIIRNPFNAIEKSAASARRCSSCTAPKTPSCRSRRDAGCSMRRPRPRRSSRCGAATSNRARSTATCSTARSDPS